MRIYYYTPSSFVALEWGSTNVYFSCWAEDGKTPKNSTRNLSRHKATVRLIAIHGAARAQQHAPVSTAVVASGHRKPQQKRTRNIGSTSDRSRASRQRQLLSELPSPKQENHLLARSWLGLAQVRMADVPPLRCKPKLRGSYCTRHTCSDCRNTPFVRPACRRRPYFSLLVI